MLLRIAKKSFNDTLLIDEKMYMNPPEIFRPFDDGGRGDRKENCVYDGKYKLYIRNDSESEYDLFIDNSNNSSPININNGIRVFCFSYIDELSLIYENRNQPFDLVFEWDTIEKFWTDKEDMEILCFTDVKSLFNLFDNSVRNQGLCSRRGAVRYDQEKIVSNPHFLDDVDKSPFKYAFHKAGKYSKQNEYRFALQTDKNNDEPFLLNLPEMNRITVSRIKLNKGNNITFRISNENENKICCEVIV